MELRTTLGAIINDLSGNYLLVSRRGWWGLPRGKLEDSEHWEGFDFMDTQCVHPRLYQEILEETGIDLIAERVINGVACLGIATILAHYEEPRVVEMDSVIFVISVSALRPIKRSDVMVANWRDMAPRSINLYPDAELAVARMRRGGSGWILPEWLNPTAEPIHFRMTEPMGVFEPDEY